MSLLDRIVPPVELEGADGIVKPSRMQHQEQLATALLGAVNAVVCAVLLVVIPGRASDPGKAATLRLLLAGGIVASLLCIPAARKGNRLIAGLVLLAAGFLGPGAVNPFLVIPHYGVAIWMVLRQNRLVKEQAVVRRKQREEARARGGTARAPAAGRSGRTTPKLPDGRPAPPPSKRYTPPRPKKRTAAPKARAGDDG